MQVRKTRLFFALRVAVCRGVPPSVTLSGVVLDNDEIEVACDALWFVKRRGAVDEVQERLWDRLQALRTGDYGGSAQVDLAPGEIEAMARAMRYAADEIALDEDEQRLLARLAAPDGVRTD
jgi:hypothetical protein